VAAKKLVKKRVAPKKAKKAVKAPAPPKEHPLAAQLVTVQRLLLAKRPTHPLGVGFDLIRVVETIKADADNLHEDLGADGLRQFVVENTSEDGQKHLAINWHDFGDFKDPQHGEPHVVNTGLLHLGCLMAGVLELTQALGVAVTDVLKEAETVLNAE
jgi:hypothetical protein